MMTFLAKLFLALILHGAPTGGVAPYVDDVTYILPKPPAMKPPTPPARHGHDICVSGSCT